MARSLVSSLSIPRREVLISIGMIPVFQFISLFLGEVVRGTSSVLLLIFVNLARYPYLFVF